MHRDLTDLREKLVRLKDYIPTQPDGPYKDELLGMQSQLEGIIDAELARRHEEKAPFTAPLVLGDR